MTKITQKLFKEVIPGTAGIQTVIAKRLKVDDATVMRFLERYPEMKKLQDLERLKEVDIAEREIFSQLRLGTTKETKHLFLDVDFIKIRANAAFKIVKNLGKDRGWSEKTELEIAGTINSTSLTKEELEKTIKRLLGK